MPVRPGPEAVVPREQTRPLVLQLGDRNDFGFAMLQFRITFKDYIEMHKFNQP